MLNNGVNKMINAVPETEAEAMQRRAFLKRMAEWILGQPDVPQGYKAWAEGQLDNAATDEAREQERLGREAGDMLADDEEAGQ